LIDIKKKRIEWENNSPKSIHFDAQYEGILSRSERMNKKEMLRPVFIALEKWVIHRNCHQHIGPISSVLYILLSNIPP